MVLMFGLIAIAGVRILVSHGIRRREAVIAATSVGLGLGVAFEPEVFKNLPVLFQKLNFRRRYYGGIVELGFAGG